MFYFNYVITIKQTIMTHYKSLTWRQIENLTETGFYRLPFMNDDHDVEVLYITPNDDSARMKCIIAKMEDGSIQDFYYNDSVCMFKPLTVSYAEDKEYDIEEALTTFGESWINENVGIDCPPQYADCIGQFDEIAYEW